MKEQTDNAQTDKEAQQAQLCEILCSEAVSLLEFVSIIIKLTCVGQDLWTGRLAADFKVIRITQGSFKSKLI